MVNKILIFINGSNIFDARGHKRLSGKITSVELLGWVKLTLDSNLTRLLGLKDSGIVSTNDVCFLCRLTSLVRKVFNIPATWKLYLTNRSARVILRANTLR